MNKILKQALCLRQLEQFARRHNTINDLSPVLKIIMTIIYVIMVSSKGNLELDSIIILGLYPIVVILIADVPFSAIGSKLIIPLILALSLSIFNIFIYKEVVLTVGSIGISGGVISLFGMIIKSIWIVMSTLLLVATTSIEKLAKGLRALHVPQNIILLFVIIYRYIDVFLNEVSNTILAYNLRANTNRVHISVIGPMLGQMIIRSYYRATDIYNSMLLGGYNDRLE